MDLCVGYGALFTCCYGLCALVSGLFRDNGRGWFAVCALLSGLCAAMLGVDHALFVPLILELICAVAAFAALPPMVWDAVRHSLLPDTLMGESARRNVRRTAGKCATEAAQAFYELYLAMLNGVSEGRAAGDHNVRVVFDRASDRVCKHCVLCAQCWQRDYVTTLAAFNDVTQPMLKRGRAELTDFPYHFASRCVHLPELMRAINSALFALRERQSLRRQQEENQSLLARQYAGITDILRQLGAEVTQDVTAQPMMERQVRRYASAFGWIDNVCAVRDAQGRLVIELYGEGIDDVLQQGEGFSAGLSALLGIGLTRPKKVEEGDTVHLEMRERAPGVAVELPPFGGQVVRARPMDKVEVEVIRPELLQRALERRKRVFVAHFVLPQLGGQKQLLARHACGFQRVAERLLGAVERGGVKMPVAGSECGGDRAVVLFACQIGAVADGGDLHAVR